MGSRYLLAAVLFLLLPHFSLYAAEKISIVFPPNYPPMSYIDDNGELTGLLPETWNLWSEKTGIEIDKMVAESWADSLNLIRYQQADVHCGLSYTPERDRYMDFSNTILSLDSHLFTLPGKQNLPLYNSKKIRIIVFPDTLQYDYLHRQYPDMTLIPYSDPLESIMLLKENKADGLLGETAFFASLFQSEGILDELVIKNTPEITGFIHAGVHNDNWNLLREINNGLSMISAEEMTELKNRWFPDNRQSEYITSSLDIDLSEEEKLFLSKHPTIIGGYLNNPPIFFQDSSGKNLGILADYLNLIKSRSGMNITRTGFREWNTIYNEFLQGDPLVLVAVPTEEREKTMVFSQPFMTLHTVMVLGEQNRHILRLGDLQGESVGIIAGDYIGELLRKDFPDLNIVTVPDELSGLLAVYNGDIDIFVGNESSIMANLYLNGLFNKVIIKELSYSSPLCFSALKENEIAITIIDKVLDTVPPEERDQIYESWIHDYYRNQRISPGLIRKAGPFLLVVILAIVAYIIWSISSIIERRKYQILLEHATDRFFIIDKKGVLKNRTKTLNAPQTVFTLLKPVDQEELSNALFRCGEQPGNIVKTEIQTSLYDASGSLRDYEVNLQNLEHHKGIQGIVMDIRDITKRKDLERELIKSKKEAEKIARTDYLTGIPNRLFFMEMAEREFSRMERAKSGVISLLMIDVDHFKAINDQNGHDKGDSVLNQLASILNAEIRTTDFLARYGGEEFAALLIDNDDSQALQSAERLRQAIEKNANWGIDRTVTISIGVASTAQGINSLGVLINRADKALYQAKDAGRNRVVVFKEEE